MIIFGITKLSLRGNSLSWYGMGDNQQPDRYF